MDQWFLRRIIDICWHDIVRNANICRHHFHQSLSTVVLLSLGILYDWMRTQMLAKPSSNFLQRTGGYHRGDCTQLGWRTFMMTCFHCILGYMRLEIWCKIGLSWDWCLCTELCTRSGACCYWIGLDSSSAFFVVGVYGLMTWRVNIITEQWFYLHLR